MKLTATVKDNDGVMVITRDTYESKSAFKDDLHRNGFTVIGRIYADGDEKTREGNLYWNLGIK